MNGATEAANFRDDGLGLVVDLFAGAGGASTGLEAAIGRAVDIAINHDPLALQVHAENHPGTTHLTADVWEVDPLEATQGRRVSILWASPDCTHFSIAKGGKPKKQRIRSLAWVVVKWAKATRPEMIFLENVREFRGWGPLDREGRPIKARMGETFKRWRRQLERLGYTVEERVLDASEYGAPTKRKRLFVVARLDGANAWPTKTHGKAPGLLPLRAAAECIDWSIPVRSIFGRKKPLAAKTMWRIFQGVKRYVLEHPRPFLVKFRGDAHSSDLGEPMPTILAGGNKLGEVRAFLTAFYGSDGPGGQELLEPARTITARHRLGLVYVEGSAYQIVDIGLRMLEPEELLRAQFGRFAASYDLTAARTKSGRVRLIGNSVCPEVAEALVLANLETLRAEAVA